MGPWALFFNPLAECWSIMWSFIMCGFIVGYYFTGWAPNAEWGFIFQPQRQ